MKDMINLGIAFDVITRSGAYYSFGEGRWQGKEKVIAAFREDIDLQKELVSKVERGFSIIR